MAWRRRVIPGWTMMEAVVLSTLPAPLLTLHQSEVVSKIFSGYEQPRQGTFDRMADVSRQSHVPLEP